LDFARAETYVSRVKRAVRGPPNPLIRKLTFAPRSGILSAESHYVKEPPLRFDHTASLNRTPFRRGELE
jgi:hypothetical protein